MALEDRACAALALGDHGTVAADLEALTTAHPLRERLWSLRASHSPGRAVRPTPSTPCATSGRCSTPSWAWSRG